MTIPVIDLFAGPGGLGEGFSRSANGDFRITISIEKDGMAHETLRLRAAHRELMRNPAMTQEAWTLWDRLVEETPWKDLFDSLQTCDNPAIRAACAHAGNEALQLELGTGNRELVATEIRRRLPVTSAQGSSAFEPLLMGNRSPLVSRTLLDETEMMRLVEVPCRVQTCKGPQVSGVAELDESKAMPAADPAVPSGN